MPFMCFKRAPSLCKVIKAPFWMYVGQFLAVSVLEWLYFKIVIIRGGGEGWIFGQCFNVSVHLRGGKGLGLGSNYHNWSKPRVSSSSEGTGQGLPPLKQEHFFAPKSSSTRSFF